jgi:transcriptional regulator with XRE-family HTH domain
VYEKAQTKRRPRMETTFSILLKTYRKNMRWTQEEMSENWSYSFETISAWERGKRTPSHQEIPRLAKFLEIDPKELADIIVYSREKRGSSTKKSTSYEIRADWKASYETWGELQHIYRTRTDFSRNFSYLRMFKNAHSILAAGISLSAIAKGDEREEIPRLVLENNCSIQLCFLDPLGKRCAEREEEENQDSGVLSKTTDGNIFYIKRIRDRIAKTNKEQSKLLEIRIYDMIPRYNIYIVDDTLMTVQSYAYGRGQETPTLVLEKKGDGGLFDFYSSAARHIYEHSKDIDDIIPKEQKNT